jgi:flagellar biosynthesis protein FlhB
VSDVAEKPFEATPHRIAKAKREGNVARSGEFAANLSFAAGGLSVVAIAPMLGTIAGASLAAGSSTANSVTRAGLIVGTALIPIGAAALAGSFANFVQSGGLTLVDVAPKFERLNPVEGIKRILSRETLTHSLRASLAFACAIAAMAPVVAWSATTLLRSDTLGDAATVTWIAAREVAGAALGVGLFFAIAEYGAARSAWLRKLRMSFAERKRDAKEEEGDATARGRRRALHRALLRSGFSRLKEAAFVVANPVHVAVALEYRPPQVPVPRVLVRAADAAATAVRRVAAEHRIPIVENVALARALFRDTRAGEPIPHLHYVAVAEVVAALLRQGAMR